jgi:hypothetical protein
VVVTGKSVLNVNLGLIMQIDISKQEAWKLLDAIKSYISDYTVTGQVNKIFDNISKKLKKIVED